MKPRVKCIICGEPVGKCKPGLSVEGRFLPVSYRDLLTGLPVVNMVGVALDASTVRYDGTLVTRDGGVPYARLPLGFGTRVY